MRRALMLVSIVSLSGVLSKTALAFWTPIPTPIPIVLDRSPFLMHRQTHRKAQAGSFFNPVPERENNSEDTGWEDDVQIDDRLHVLRPQEQQRPYQPKAIEPSTINGVPSSRVVAASLTVTSGTIQTDPKSSKPYVGVGPSSLNDVTNPEYDDQGYTLYANEKTGKKSRVFEALVEYPCLFTLKVVGANEGEFVRDILAIVASTCRTIEVDNKTPDSNNEAMDPDLVDVTKIIDHTVKVNGKWTSITIQAPVQSAQMLYQLYENVDQDPRVKFKF